MTSPVSDPTHAPDPSLAEVADGVFAYVQPDGSWGLNNTGALVGRDGVALIDTCFTEARTRALLGAVRSVTDRPLRTLVNTHHHGDHTHGNWLVPEATIIGHDRCREAVLASGHAAAGAFPGVDWGEVRITPPFVTFSDHLTLHVDERRVELLFVGPAHTTNDIVAWLPEERLLFAGDLAFNGGTPFVLMGSVAGSLAALDRLEHLGPRTVVPGHGPVSGPEVLEDQRDYLRFVQGVAEEADCAGVDPLDAARDTDLGRFAGWHDQERLVGNLHRARSERRGEALGTDLDVVTAFGEMVTYNGGQALRCLA